MQMVNNMGKEYYELLSARDVLVMENLSDERQFMVKYYFDNSHELKRLLGLNENERLPADLPWGVLARHIWQLEEDQAFESCMEYFELKGEAEYDAASDDENGIEEYQFDKGISRDAVMEEGSPFDECDDFEYRYRNKI